MAGFHRARIAAADEDPVDTRAPFDVRFRYDWQANQNIKTLPHLPDHQILAGHRHGAQVLPRCGDEILVSYENSHPERLAVIGSVHNDKRKSGFTKASQSGIVVKSLDDSPGGKRTHTLIFDDDAKTPGITNHSPGEWLHVSTSDTELTIGGAGTEKVVGSKTREVKGPAVYAADDSLTFSAGASKIKLNATGITLEGVSIPIANEIA